jgi:phage N-6-adenine-methyltransferase
VGDTANPGPILKGEQLSLLEPAIPLVTDLDYQFTPREVLIPLHDEFRFTLDPCASAECFSAQLIGRWYGEADNGLVQSWVGHRVFLNPPYSNIGEWLEKAMRELSLGCKLVVAHLPSWTDRAWWHKYIEPYRELAGGPQLRFLKGRVTHGAPGNPLGVGRDCATFPNVHVIWRGVSP